MITFFKKLPLPSKLILIGLVPSFFLIYISIEFYASENQKLRLLNDYIKGINRATVVDQLIDQLQEERRAAFEFALKKDALPELLRQEQLTDAIINKLDHDRELSGFEKYTMLDSLHAIRQGNATGKLYNGVVMNFYTSAIFRINMLETTPQLQMENAAPLNRNLHSARSLDHMITYFGIIRSVIYNVLYTRQFKYGNGTLVGLTGVYQVFSTYQTEFITKSPPRLVNDYGRLMQTPALKSVTGYLTTGFRTMQFDSTAYNDVQWWNVSGEAVDQLHALEAKIWVDVHRQLDHIKLTEQYKVDRLLFLLVLALALSITIIASTIVFITKMLVELRVAAEKIAAGETGLMLDIRSDDVVGKLANSVMLIDDNNKKLAEAADEIRKGNFEIAVTPRAEADILGNSLLQMKNELQRYTNEKTEQAAELERLLIAVTARENQFRQIADQTPFMIWQFNNAGEAIYVNKQWIEFTGLSLDDSLGMGWTRALHPGDMREASFIDAFANHRSFRSKTRVKNAQNEFRWALVQIDPVYGDDIDGFIGSLTDITDQILAQQAIIDLMDKKDEFLTIASHELKTPLTSIKGYTQLLKRNIGVDEKSYPLVTKTLHHIDRLDKLVRDLLDVSRINSGQMVYDDEDFEFADSLNQIVGYFADLSAKHKVVVDRSESATIKGDRSRIEQVLNNLILNAIKYSPDADNIKVSSYKKGNDLIVSVQDFGIGIEEEDLVKLFDKFYRTQKDFYKFQGLGLGLFISNEIINRHKGKIWVESKPGEGSVFYFSLPLNGIVPLSVEA